MTDTRMIDILWEVLVKNIKTGKGNYRKMRNDLRKSGISYDELQNRPTTEEKLATLRQIFGG